MAWPFAHGGTHAAGWRAELLTLLAAESLDQNFLASLVLPTGMRTLLYRNVEQGFVPSALTDAEWPGCPGGSIRSHHRTDSTHYTARSADGELVDESGGRGNVSCHPACSDEIMNCSACCWREVRARLVALTLHIFQIAAAVAGAALLVGLLISLWISARVTRPVEELAAGAREVAAGRWERIRVRWRDEIGQLADAFNEMTRSSPSSASAWCRPSAWPPGANWRAAWRTN